MKQDILPDADLDNLDQFVRLSFFADIGIGIAAANTINEAMDQVMKKIGEIFSPISWSLLLVDKETDELYFKLTTGPNAEKLQDVRMPKNEGVAGWIVENGQSVLIDDVSKDPRHSTRMDDLSGFKTKSLIGVPLKVDSEVIGVIELINKLDEAPFTATELKVLSTIAEYAAITIEKVYYLSALKDLANTDPLTGVFNRRQLDNVLQKEIERCKRYGPNLAMIILDVDDMKKINDERGHSAGDQVLKDVTRIMHNNIRKVDVLGRFGGDEFVILLPHTKKHEAENVRQRIYRDIEQENTSGKEIPFTVTMGLHSDGPDKVDNLLDSADSQLLREKRRRKRKKSN
jgi:diguanylate cyclase (GGDEF)-like protein